MPTTLIAEVVRVTFESEATSFRVIRVAPLEKAHGEELVVVGVFQAVGAGSQVRVTGEFTEDKRHGRQFRAESLVALAPATEAGIEKYLGSGLIKGVGPKLAQRIVSHFGSRALEVLDQEPERLREVPKLGRKVIERIKATWIEQREISNLMLLLQSHGASASLATRIFKHYGKRSTSIVQGSPYRLALQVRGIGFRTADRIAESLGIVRDHPERAQAGVLHELEASSVEGHTVISRERLVERTERLLEIEASHVEAAIDVLFAQGRLLLEQNRAALPRLHLAEVAIAEGVARLLTFEAKPIEDLEMLLGSFEAESGLHLAAHQREAVKLATASAFSIITGGPGVGKTTIVRALLYVFDRARLGSRLGAPTGRAAQRLSETTSRAASTLHRLLEYDPRLGRFQRDREHPVEADVLVVDEASMIDAPLMAALLDAVASGSRLVLVGDKNQLPSVGPGAVLRDLLAQDQVPKVELVEIFRQAKESQIVQNAHRILHGEPLQGAGPERADPDFFVISPRDPEAASRLACELVSERIPKRFGIDPKTGIQVLIPMHRGPAGVSRVNQLLQERLNPSGPHLTVRGAKIRVGDRVLQTRNDYSKEVFNGDLGYVTRVDEEAQSLDVDFDGRVTSYEGLELEALTLAYATSIHKSQGSEYPAVVILLMSSHYLLLCRSLLYTAVTRAKKLCVLVADAKALKLALSELRAGDRDTRLQEHLARALNGRLSQGGSRAAQFIPEC